MTLKNDSDRAQYKALYEAWIAKEQRDDLLRLESQQNIKLRIIDELAQAHELLYKEPGSYQRIVSHRSLRGLAQSFLSIFPTACMDAEPAEMLLDLADKWSEESTGLLGRTCDVLLLGVHAARARIRNTPATFRRKRLPPAVVIEGATRVVYIDRNDLMAYPDTPLVLRVASDAEALKDSL